LIYRIVDIRKHEIPALILSFLYFFFLLCGYYILRPIRDEMGIQGGVENLQWVFTGTFAAMVLAVPLFGLTVALFTRRKLIPVVYYFFISNLLIFFIFFKSNLSPVWIARCFFIWLSVFNLFVVSVFWSLMTDIFSSEQSKRLFGFIAAGGTGGAVAGPAITAFFSTVAGPLNLIPVSAFFLLLSVFCIHLILRTNNEKDNEDNRLKDDFRIGGSIFAGFTNVARSPYLLGICVFMLLYSTLSTFLYFTQARIIENTFSDPAVRTTLFASMDLAVNVLTVLVQIFLTGRLAAGAGISITLMIIPVLVAAGFVFLGIFPVLPALIIFQVVRRAGNYSITRPAREMLFTVVPREDKYKAKNFIDTVVYRGGDAASGWAFAGLSAFGFSISHISFIVVPLSLFWILTGYLLGNKQEDRSGG